MTLFLPRRLILVVLVVLVVALVPWALRAFWAVLVFTFLTTDRLIDAWADWILSPP